jgi:hypothetical protein
LQAHRTPTAADEHCELRDQLYLHPADTNPSKLWGCGGNDFHAARAITVEDHFCDVGIQ